MQNTSSPTPASEWPLPLDDATDALYASVRAACVAADFTEAALCRRFGLASIVDFRSTRDGRVQHTRHDDALEILTDLFMDLVGVREDTARQHLGDATVDAMHELQLVAADPASSTHVLASMLLYPTAGVWLISDRTFARPGERLSLPTDIVYPAITRTTGLFVRMIPPSPCEAFLEMCAGNGIGAIAMASRAVQAWSLDITERATRVARFNARLNGLTNVTVAQGDLYDPVRGLTFDRIVAHPPYVPSNEQQIIYRDGGPDGEFITRRLVVELPPHLRPGGRFMATCIVTDRAGAPFEARVREWLGETQDQFDVVVAVTSAEHPSEYYFKSAINGERTFADAERRHTVLQQLHVERLVYCTFVIERHTIPRPAVTRRVMRGVTTTGDELEQYCNWLSAGDDVDLRARFMAAFPHLSRRATLRHTQRVVGDKWSTTATEIETTWPFAVTVECPDDVAQLLARCDGTRTLRQVMTAMRQKGLLKASVPDHAVLDVVASCVAAGVIHLAEPGRAGVP